MPPAPGRARRRRCTRGRALPIARGRRLQAVGARAQADASAAGADRGGPPGGIRDGPLDAGWGAEAGTERPLDGGWGQSWDGEATRASSGLPVTRDHAFLAA